MSWCFWDPRSRIQVSLHGPTVKLAEEVAQERFKGLSKHGRKSYATISAPGTAVDDPTDGLPEEWDGFELVETDYALNNFTVLQTQAIWMEVLALRREGHRRLRATRSPGSPWELTWVVP